MMAADVIVDIKVVDIHNIVQGGGAGVVSGYAVRNRGIFRS